ncbi:MAG: phenylalanine--tRNA ligase subunit alpha, partial [Halobacteriovoraceae bacterium]|nr:phenylalanine--tRNA ligase subunit alpha [Halobacteriovoraceae bacterium]
MLQKMDEIFSDFQTKMSTLDKQADVLTLKSSILGKKGSLAQILKSLKDATVEE